MGWGAYAVARVRPQFCLQIPPVGGSMCLCHMSRSHECEWSPFKLVCLFATAALHAYALDMRPFAKSFRDCLFGRSISRVRAARETLDFKQWHLFQSLVHTWHRATGDRSTWSYYGLIHADLATDDIIAKGLEIVHESLILFQCGACLWSCSSRLQPVPLTFETCTPNSTNPDSCSRRNSNFV
jgi:hypothetical protein